MQVYVPIWTFTEGLEVESKSIGVFRDPKSAFLVLLKKCIDEGYILRANKKIPFVSFYDTIDSLCGLHEKDDISYEMKEMSMIQSARVMNNINNIHDTTKTFATFLYEKYIGDKDLDDIDKMNSGLERLVEECATKYFVENFKGCVCSNKFF